MAEYSRHDPANSNTITQQEYEDMNAPHDPGGVIGAYGDTSIVYADGSGRLVKIRANKKAKVRGRTWYNDAAEMQLTIAPNTAGAGLTRIDTIVARLYRYTVGPAPAAQAWQIRLAVVQGVAAAQPVAPALTQQTGSGNTVWELPLADVTVGNGVAVINAGNVMSREWYVGIDGSVIQPATIGGAPTVKPVGLGVDTRLWQPDLNRELRWDGSAWRMVAGQLLFARTWSGAASFITGVAAGVTATVFTTPTIAIEPNQGYEVDWLFLLANVSGASGQGWTNLHASINGGAFAQVTWSAHTPFNVLNGRWRMGRRFIWRAGAGETSVAFRFEASANGSTWDVWQDGAHVNVASTGKLSSEIL